MKKIEFRCIACNGLLINRYAKRCRKCYRKYVKNPINSPNWKGGWKNKLPNCIDCNKNLLYYNSKRCYPCSIIERERIRIKKKYLCIDCGKTRNRHSNLRCRGCYRANCKISGYKSGKKNPSWLGGISRRPYSFAFSNELKIKIRTRDKWICQKCGMTQKRHMNHYKRSLEVHHINYNKQDCSESNLITTCHICNTKANFNRDYWYAYYRYIVENNILCHQ